MVLISLTGDGILEGDDDDDGDAALDIGEDSDGEVTAKPVIPRLQNSLALALCERREEKRKGKRVKRKGRRTGKERGGWEGAIKGRKV